MIRLNSDKNLVDTLVKAIKENNGYCPCKVEKTDDNKCMCKEFRQQKDGECHCGLYVKEIV